MADFFEFSNELMVLADLQGKFTRVNPAWTAALGWTTKELTSRQYFDFIHPDDLERTIAEAQLLNTGTHQTITFENRYRCRDGSYRWLSWYAKSDLEAGEIVATARDVTQQKEQAEALRVSEERLRLVMDAANDAIWDADLKTGTIWWNEAYNRAFGVRPKDTATSWDWWIEHIHPEDRQRVQSTLMKAVDDCDDRWVCEYRYRRTDGAYATVLDRALLACDEHGKTARLLGAMLDLSEQKKTEQALRAQEQTIRRLFRLQDQERRLTSHDIHDGLAQLIVGASLHVEAALVHVDKSLLPSLAKAGELLRQAMTESRRLINDLRPMIIEESGITDSVRHLIGELTRSSACEFRLTSELKVNKFEPLFDSVVFRIVQEAVANALRHGQASSVQIDLRQDGPWLHISITDDGDGFDPNAIPPDRLGVRGIIERAQLYGGDAIFKSRIGHGARVQVRMRAPEVDDLPGSA